MQKRYDRLLIVLLGLILSSITFAQPKDNSPISRYGIGDLYRGDFNQTGATGGLFGAWVDPYRVNPVNPASLPYLQSTSLEFGFFAKANEYRRDNARQSVWSGNLDYISLAFPLKSKINEMLEPSKSPWEYAMGVHVAPYSLVGYDVEFTQYVSDIDTVRNIFQGQGGLSQVAWAGGIKYKQLSFGVQAGYVFGSITNNYQLDLQSAQSAYSTRNFSSINLRAYTWQLGSMYRIAMDPPNKDLTIDRKRRWINIGIYGGTNTGFSSLTDQLVERVNPDYSAGGTPIARDTIIQTIGGKGSGTLPGRFGGGVTLQRAESYQVGVNAEYRNWSVFKLTEEDNLDLSFRNTWRFSAGGEWTPNPAAFRKYFQTIRYRAGLFLEQEARVIEGQKTSGFGVQLGFGFPIVLPRQQISFIDLALEAGQRGTASVQQDKYIRIRLAATLNDNSWFFKRKYN